jgi:hypothetical protein
MPVEERAAESLLSIPFGLNGSSPAQVVCCGGHRSHRVTGTLTKNQVKFHPPCSQHGNNALHQTPKATEMIL